MNSCNKNCKDIRAIKLFREIHDIGGCDGDEPFIKGWDKAIESCEELITEIFGVDFDDLDCLVGGSEKTSTDSNYKDEPRDLATVALEEHQRSEAFNRNTQEPIDDPVNHPSHYTSGRIEVIDFIEDQKLPYHLGNAMKYICRAGKKDPDKTVEDLRKAVWYTNRYIEFLEKNQKDNNSTDSGNATSSKKVG